MPEASENIAPKPSLEIKPSRPGLLKDNLRQYTTKKGEVRNERTQPKDQLDYLMVFGQGPVLDEATKEKPDLKKPAPKKITAIAWMKNTARAAGELYLEGATKKIILTGGRTGGESFKSEAETMRDILINEYNIPETDIILEDNATNTLQNIPLSLNKIDLEKLPDSSKPKIGLLGADFHVPRIRILADIFGIGDSKSFSSEQIFRTIAYKLEETGKPEKIAEARQIHQQLDALLSMNDDLSFPGSKLTSKVTSPTLFERQKGKEREGFREKKSLDAFFTRGIVEVPEFWFGYMYFLNNERLGQIIQNTDDTLLSRFGIKKDTPLDEIRKTLKPYTEAKNQGGKRLGLEEFYEIEVKNLTKDELTIKKAEVGAGHNDKTKYARAALEKIADRLNSLGNK